MTKCILKKKKHSKEQEHTIHRSQECQEEKKIHEEKARKERERERDWQTDTKKTLMDRQINVELEKSEWREQKRKHLRYEMTP